MREGLRAISRWRLGLASVVLAGSANVLAAPPAAAYVTIHDTGTHGAVILTDTAQDPAGRCFYGAENQSGVAAVRNIRVLAPDVYAADRNDQRNHRRVAWRVKIQRSESPGPWVDVATSAWQGGTAFDITPADLSPIKVAWHAQRDNSLVRAVFIVRWYKPNDTVEAELKARIQYYDVKWTVGNPDFIFTDACWSSSD